MKSFTEIFRENPKVQMGPVCHIGRWRVKCKRLSDCVYGSSFCMSWDCARGMRNECRMGTARHINWPMYNVIEFQRERETRCTDIWVYEYNNNTHTRTNSLNYKQQSEKAKEKTGFQFRPAIIYYTERNMNYAKWTEKELIFGCKQNIMRWMRQY